MIKNHLKITLRTMQRNKAFSFLNILGLSIGIATFIAIGLYVVDEFSFDQFHEKKDRIYRAIIAADLGGQTSKWGAVPNRMAPTAAKEIPEIEKAARVFHHNFGNIGFISTETEKFSETELFFADKEVLDIFTIPLIRGNSKTALDRPGTVILSERASIKYFGTEDPIGKTLLVDNSLDLEVTGVYRDFPSNSFLQCQLVASFSSIWFGKEQNQSWGNASFDTYFLLGEGVRTEVVEKKISEMLESNIRPDNRWFSISLQPLLDIRLHSNDLTSSMDKSQYGDINQVKILGAMALVILIIAGVNYMNLTTAQSQRRNKEVGISKTLGATFGQLSGKFYFETAFIIFISMCTGVLLFLILIPQFNGISGKVISSNFIYQKWFLLSYCFVWLVLTLFSGSYPAFYLSSFSPKLALLNRSQAGLQSSIRKGLVVFQFSISITLIICAAVFYQQMNFIRDKKLGYQPEQVIAVMVTPAKNRDQLISIKSEFEALAGVTKVSRSQSYPGIGTSMFNLVRDGENGQGISILTSRATHEILDVLGINLLAGATLPENKDTSDTTVQVILNKSAVDYLKMTPQEAIGKQVRIFDEGYSEVVGVVEDFHYSSLQQKIGPYCFTNNRGTGGYSYLLVKVQTDNLSGIIEKLEYTFKKIIPAAFEYTFLDQQMARLHESEERLSNIVLIFAGLAIFIACLGLYALSAFTAEQRTRELGIRKLLGASVPQLVSMLSREFVLLVFVALMISVPFGYFLAHNWLMNFAYQIDIGAGIFLVSGVVVLLIAVTTVSFESFKAANRNPVESLKTE